MKNVMIVGCCLVFLWLYLSVPVCCQINVFEVEVSPYQPREDDNAILTCQATGFDPTLHEFLWQISVNATWVDVTASDRISISPAYPIPELATLYYQTLTISHLKKSDEGIFLCVVFEKDGKNNVGNGQGYLTVNYTEEFPVCFPDGPAAVKEGDTLSCRAVIDARTPVVSVIEKPVERPDWVNTSQAEGTSGSELRKNVTIQDDGNTFLCFSIRPENENWTSLVCKIGPLTVIPLIKPTSSPPLVSPIAPVLSIAAIVGIVVGGFILLVLCLIHTVCCHCNPKRWFKAKSYLLDFGGFFSGTIRQTDTDRRQPELEMGSDNPALSDEPFPNGSNSGDQVMFSFEGGEDAIAHPEKSEPNIYVERSFPGTSTQEEAAAETDDDYWNPNLKQQLADALESEEQSD